MDRSRVLLQRHLKQMEFEDQNVIRETYEEWVQFTSHIGSLIYVKTV